MAMLSRAVLIMLAALAAAFGAGTAAARPDAPAAEAPKVQHEDALRLLELWLDAQAAFDRVPALSAGVVVGPERVWTRGYGFVDGQRTRPADARTLYLVCSVSKLFTAVAVMQLWEAERFALDDDIAKLLPTLALRRAGPDAGRITVRALLTHSAGLARETAAASWPPASWTGPSREQILAQLAGQDAFLGPSERLQYSNLGMVVLGELVAAVSGQPYETAVAQRVLAPLQMTQTRPAVAADLPGVQLPQGHSSLKRDGSRDPLPPFEPRGLLPAAGFVSSVADLARFARWQFRLLRGGGREVLQASTLREMQRVQWTDPDGQASWGLGFAVGREGQNTVVSHAGRCPGYESAIALALKDEVAVVALASAQNAGPYTRQMRQLMLKGLRLPVAPTGGDGPDLAAYAGRYAAQPWTSERVIVPWGKDLALLNLPSANPAADLAILRHASGDTFHRVRDDGSKDYAVVFTRDAANAVTGYREWNYAFEKLGPLPAGRGGVDQASR